MTADGSKLINKKVKVAEGYYADQKLRVGGIIFLEDTLDMGFDAIADDLQKSLDGDVKISTMVNKIRPFLLALMHQCHRDVSVEDLTEVIDQLEIDEFTELFGKLRLFSDKPVKNSQGPTAGTKRPRRPVTQKKSHGRKSSSA